MPFGVSAAQAQSVSVSFQLFFDQLEPHGVWVRHAKYNYVFCPTGVDASWRPYTHGRWLYVKDRGWYFDSDEPFAWATYHYGRWFADQSLGWCWVPGTKWAPAWVSWRRSDSVVGWAPLPPVGEGYAVSVSRGDLPEGYWVFVPTESFVEPDLSVNIVIGSQQPDYYTQTEFLGPVKVEGDVVINNVIDVSYIEQTINQQVIVYQPQEAEDPAAQAVDVDAKAVTIFDQDVAEPAAEVAPPEPVEETDAAATIETEGGTAGATTDLPDETGAATEAPDAGTQPAEPAATQGTPAPEEPATEQPTTEQPSAQPAAPSEDAGAPTDNGDQQAPATEAPAETQAPPTADQPAAEGEAGQPEEGKQTPCAPDAMVDGKCPPAADQPSVAPETETQAPEQTQPAPEAAPEAAPVPESAPTPEETAPAAEPATEAAPAPDAEAAPADEPAMQEGVAPEEATPGNAPACPPETMVDGKCPVVPTQ
ncbi:MAG TPA: DUF6600 domain-containing protein [Devosia sp.]|nr:DUF6600 domain-containing protein [Devosia sp.]